MRIRLLATTAAVALLAATSARAQNATWLLNPGSRIFNAATNWTPPAVPTNTAIFGASNKTSIIFLPFTTTSIGTLQFNPGAPAYSFNTSVPLFTTIRITGAGIVNDSSNAPTFTIGNLANLFFVNSSTAANATIITNSGGITGFTDSATGGNARFIANGGGVFDISALSAGGMTAGSIEGAGTFELGSKQLTVGSNNLSTTVSGAIIGTGGSLVKTGGGTLTLSGTNSYTGPTTVNAGTLIVDGSIAPSGLTTANSGGTLGGTGTVGNTQINSGGVFAPGSGSAGSSMTVTGNLAFQSGALYLVQVNSSTASFANVTGTASLAGIVDAHLTSGVFTTTKTYDILHSSGLGGTRFNTLIISNPNLGASLTYTATDVFLTLKAALGGGANLNENQQNVANALNNFVNGGGTLPPGFASLFGLTGGTLANALSQLDGEVATGAERAAIQLTQLLPHIVDRTPSGAGA